MRALHRERERERAEVSELSSPCGKLDCEKTASTIVVRLFSVCYENDSRERKSEALFLSEREREEKEFAIEGKK